MPDRLAEIRARLDAATPGPWHWGRNESESFCWIMRSHGAYGQYDHHADTRTTDDAHFIAHTPADIAWLLTELSARDSDVEDIYDLRDQVNALWDVVHVLATDDGVAQAQAHYTERLEAHRNARRPHD